MQGCAQPLRLEALATVRLRCPPHCGQCVAKETADMRIKAIIFDVDGTLAETEEGHRQAFNQAFADAGLAWHWDLALYGKLLAVAGGKERIGFYIDDFLSGPARPADRQALVKRLHAAKTLHYTAMVREGRIALRPGIERLIEQAHRDGVKLAIATTTTRENVEALLEAGLGARWATLFEAIGCGDVVPRKKPAPDVYHWVLHALGLSAAECIALEDSQIGLAASLAAGIRTFITLNDYTRQQNFEGAAAVFEDLSDLPAFLRASGLALD
jgi:HAD superfamily hydrolase (TIGR01509 family)